MIFLTDNESRIWHQSALRILEKKAKPGIFDTEIRKDLRGAFNFYCGTLLSSQGFVKEAKKWFIEGAGQEQEGLMLNMYVLGFLERHNDNFAMPVVVFEDPQPFIHFSTTPQLEGARKKFVEYIANAMPQIKGPLRIMDIGTGDGALLVMFLEKLIEKQKINGVEEILLIDSSRAMTELAEKTVGKVFGCSVVKSVQSRIQDFSASIERDYHIALSSLAYHHMPYELKHKHLLDIRKHIQNFVIFELDANNDTPVLNSPELALSVYQSYGRIIDFIFAHDSSVEIVQSAVDCFLISEAVSLMTQERTVRTEYHMLRKQWHRLFETALEGFQCLCDVTCHSDEHLDLFGMHYGG